MIALVYATLFLIVAVCLFWFVVPHKWRTKFLLVTSIGLMAVFSINFTVYFILNALVIYFAGVHMNKEGSNRLLILKLSLLWLIGSLAAFKYINILLASVSGMGLQETVEKGAGFAEIALPMGMSYIVFRLIHYIVEMYRKSFPEHTFWDLGAYVFFFPTFIAGPVERFQKFYPQSVEEKSVDASDINYGMMRIISGVVKKFIVADTMYPYIIQLLRSPQDVPGYMVLLGIYGLAIQVYMDFSGYTDMALGVSRLFGYKIVENFNYPFFKKNIAMFWRNWHMSVYSFIRDYFFFPFFAYRASQAKIYIGMLVTLVVFLLWHELSWPFFIVGVYHGLGLIVWQYFQEIKRKNPRIQKLVDNKIADPISIFVTFNFVSISMIIFYFDVSSIEAILFRIFTG